MKIADIDTNEKVFIIAEIGNNHEGNYSLALKMIEKVKKAGADAVKFQTIIPEKLVSNDQTERINQLKRFQFSYRQYEKLKKFCDKVGIIFLSTPFDIESVDFLNALVPAFKISSGDNTFYPLLERVAQTGKPIIMSTGISTLKSIANSIKIIEATWKSNKFLTTDLALLHCNVSYPTPVRDINLRAIQSLQTYGYTVGYSDHYIGNDAAIFSVALGARIIEKHFTFDKTRETFRDHQLSADSDDLKYIVDKIRLVEMMLGNSEKNVTESESFSKESVQRSIAFKRDMKKGETIKMEDLIWLRPGSGIPCGEESIVLNKILLKTYKKGELIKIKDIS